MKTNSPKMTLSSEFLDKLIRYILAKDLDNTMEIPTKLVNRIPYGRRLAEQYRQEDLDHMLAYLDSFKLNSLELAVLDNLTVWAFRNSGTLIRSALGLVGATVTQLLSTYDEPDGPVAATNCSSLTEKFCQEDAWVIRRVIRNAIATGPIEAKLPLRDMEKEIEHMANLSKAAPTVIALEKARLERLLPIIKVDTDIVSNGDRVDFIASVLIQITRAVQEYKREEDFGRLRSFMTNCIHVTGMIRMFSDDQELIRLASDVLDQAHSVDRLLSSNCIAATSLIERMGRGELVYSDILDLGKHQHRIMAVEATSVIGLFSYLVSRSCTIIQTNTDVFRMFSRLIRFAGVGARYTHEIQVVNAA